MLTACGIETKHMKTLTFLQLLLVATVLTACGIETCAFSIPQTKNFLKLQQCLPLAVLKPYRKEHLSKLIFHFVATVLTACGIETALRTHLPHGKVHVATVLTACGIET